MRTELISIDGLVQTVKISLKDLLPHTSFHLSVNTEEYYSTQLQSTVL